MDSASAIEEAHSLVRAEGIFGGVSSGAVMHAFHRMAAKMESGTIVVMFSDGGWKYLPAKPLDAAHEGLEALDDVHWW